MDQLNIPVLLGTNRKERKSHFVAKWLVGRWRSGRRFARGSLMSLTFICRTTTTARD